MTNVIHLRDNDYEGQEIKEGRVLNDICELANINLQEPPQDLLIFPQSFTNIKDKSHELPILTLKDIETDKTARKTNLKSVKVCTGNLMGFVGKGNTSVSIHSRFTYSKDNKKYGEDYFLYYMLQKVFNINLDHALNRNDKIMDLSRSESE